jgi:acyl phosphate:glycerol-3-phosphate acyltransferase
MGRVAPKAPGGVSSSKLQTNRHFRSHEIRLKLPRNLSSMDLMAALAALLFGYLCGSVPFGLVVTRLAGTPDLRSIGSGNIGATNVLRTGRKDLAAITLIADALKGTVAVLVAMHFDTGQFPPLALCAALGAFLGHVFPVWLGFKGGKGVATFLGCLLGIDWRVGLIFAAIWLAIAFAARISSAAALAASLIVPFVLFAFGEREAALLFAVLAALLWYMHRANIGRLMAGTESKIGQKK